MNEFEMMKTNPRELFDFYLKTLESGITLTEEQLIKYEYLKKLFIKEPNGWV